MLTNSVDYMDKVCICTCVFKNLPKTEQFFTNCAKEDSKQ